MKVVSEELHGPNLGAIYLFSCLPRQIAFKGASGTAAAIQRVDTVT